MDSQNNTTVELGEISAIRSEIQGVRISIDRARVRVPYASNDDLDRILGICEQLATLLSTVALNSVKGGNRVERLFAAVQPIERRK